MTDLEYANEIRKQIKALNELVKKSEDAGLDVVIWQYAKIAAHEVQVKISKTVEL